MIDRLSAASRRTVLAGLGALAMAAPTLRAGAAMPRKTLAVRAVESKVAPAGHGVEVARPTLVVTGAEPARLRQGDEVEIRFDNAMARPAVLSIRGLDGIAAAELLLARPMVPPGGGDGFVVKLERAGTLLAELGQGDGGPAAVLPLIVAEAEPPQADADEVLVIEDARLGGDGGMVAPGHDPGDAPALYTINGKAAAEIALRPRARLRLRFINGCQRNVIAVKIADHDVRVMALDSAAAEPFPARGGTLVLAPGGRVDALIDATQPPGSAAPITLLDGVRPVTLGRLVCGGDALRAAPLALAAALPDDGRPARLDLAGALRVDLALGALSPNQLDWRALDGFVPAAGPAFAVRRGRTLVLTLANRATLPVVFHLHGHHFRLLDRLDDGWKPFWLDTLAIDAGQTQRIAFAAEHAGVWLMQAAAARWSAPLLWRSYVVS